MSGNRSTSAFFEGRVGHFERRFQRERGIAHQPLLVSENYRVIAVSCGVKISAVHHLVLSQYTHLTDGQTDGRTVLRQQYPALHYVQSHGKTEFSQSFVASNFANIFQCLTKHFNMISLHGVI